MSEDEKDFVVLAVKLLFQRLKEGKVKLVADKMPETLRALNAVKFDAAGNPVYETISSQVRALANLVCIQQIETLDQEAEEREHASPVHAFLGEPVAVTEEVLRTCSEQGTLSVLAFNLYKETGIVLAVCSNC